MQESTKLTHGGIRKGAGPKRKFDKLERRTVTLMPEQVAILESLGNGNLSQGIRKAIDNMNEQQGWFNRDTYYISEQMLGDEATEQDARTMVEYLRRADYNVEYGSNMNRHPAPFSNLEWQYGLDVINKGE